MNAINFVVRTGAGNFERGAVSADGQDYLINAGAGREISLNLSQSDVQAYARSEDNLLITLADGRVILLENYFAGGGAPARVFLSAQNVISEVTFVDGGDGVLFAQYGPTEAWGKWSPADELIFVEEPEVVVADAGTTEDVSMLAAGLLGGGGLLGTLGVGAATIVGASVLVGDGDGGGGGGATAPDDTDPTVDDPDSIVDITEGTVGEDDPRVVVTGTAEPGSDVEVRIGDKIVTTTSGDDGTWEAVFEGETFPEDGVYEVVVTVTEPDGDVIELDGPSVTIDLTPPAVEITGGTVSVDDITNADAFDGGITITGTAEVGADLIVTMGSSTQGVTVGDSGTWSVTFETTDMEGGEYDVNVTVQATDAAGNTSTISDVVRIDTVPNPLGIDPVGGDDLVNQVDWSAGVSITGTSRPGETVTVSIAGSSYDVVTSAQGTWSLTLTEADLPRGEYDTQITVSSVDGAGNTSSTSATFTVDTESTVTISVGTVGGDGVVNAVEQAAGVTLTGSSDPGSSVVVSINGTDIPATVSGDGSWSVTFPAGSLPTGETTVTATATATDAAGNVATSQGVIDIDTLVTNFTMVGTPGGADGVINAVEAQGGLTMTGTTEVGSTVVVSLGTVTHTATVAANGNWTVTFAPGDLPSGEQVVDLTAVATDAAGNSETITQSVTVDTDAGLLTISPDPVEGDDIINAAEASDGVVLTGTSTPGQVVEVTLDGVTHSVTTGADGNWSAAYAASEITPGTHTAQISATITDAAGNSRTVTDSVAVDTEVTNFANGAAPIAGDNVVNAAEAAGGITFSGTTEAGGTVSVTFEGTTIAAVVDAAGNWSADFSAADIPAGSYAAIATIDTTDAAGNTATLTRAVQVDTDAPDAPEIASYTRDLTGLRGISIESSDDAIEIGHVQSDLSIDPVGNTATDIPVLGETIFAFDQTVPDGSHLVVTATDDAGNSSGTYLVLDDTTTSEVSMANPNLGGFEITKIDLQFAEDSELTITDDQLAALASQTDAVTVVGGSDDMVTITGATLTGSETDISGQGFNVYSLGDGTVWIEDDITNVVI